jgi:hypothetical protein
MHERDNCKGTCVYVAVMYREGNTKQQGTKYIGYITLRHPGWENTRIEHTYTVLVVGEQNGFAGIQSVGVNKT